MSPGNGQAGGSPSVHTLPIVLDARGERSLVAVRIQRSHTNADLAAALAVHADLEAPTVWSATRGRSLDPRAAALEDGLRAGEILAFDALDAPRSNLARLVVVGGPAAGPQQLLTEETTVGRGRASGMRIRDPALSQHHLQVSASTPVTVRDLGSTNGTFVGGAPVLLTEGTAVVAGDVIEAGDSLLSVRGPASDPHPTNGSGLVPFNRPPRVRVAGPPANHALPAPPAEATKPRLPLAAALGPLLMGGVMFVTANGAARMMGLAMAAMGPVMALVSLMETRKGASGSRRAESEKFSERLEALVTTLRRERIAEVQRLRSLHPDLPLLVDRARARAPELWARRPADLDFMSVSFGHADLQFQVAVTIAEGGSDDDRQQAMDRISPLLTLPGAPVTARLDQAGILGVAGDVEFVESVGVGVTMQIAGNHSPSDVVIVSMLSTARSERWQWLPLLPHVHAPELRLASPRLASSADDANDLLDELCELIAARRSQGDRAPATSPHLVVLIDESLGLNRARLRPLLQAGVAAGVTIVWLGADPRELPGESGLVIRPGAPGLAELAEPGSARTVPSLRIDRWDDGTVWDLAAALAALRDVSSAGAGAAIPAIVPLRQLFETEVITSELLSTRWEDQPRDITAPIGLDSDGPVSLALRRDGPHALVGGTTGAGKSELLQTWVGMLAASYPPSRLTFLLVDYKGGAAFRECVDLPHVVGMVTDLDPHLMARVVRSLRAELNHRMRVLEKNDVSDIVAFEKRGAEGLANLVIIVDEFAQLARDLPTFVEKVVEIAAIGRSLGVHLVLATQRPSEAIGPAIQANTNLRLALRTAKAEESTNIIGSPPAAFIDRSMPGRCFVKVGEGQLRQFQAAYAGTPALDDATLAVAASQLDPVEVALYDKGEPRFARATTATNPRTELNAVVEAAQGAWGARGGTAVRVPWLPPLPLVLPHDELTSPGSPEPFRLVLGRVDLPDVQEQRAWDLDLSRDGSALVYGTTGSGKTTLLRTAAVQAARLLTPSQLHIQALDFGGRGLAGLDALPHCGTVVVGEQKALVQRMVRHLARELDTRSAALERAGVTSIEEHNRAHAAAPMPRLMVLVDGLANMASAFERVDAGESLETLQRLATEGRAAGMHFIMTTNRRSGTPMAATISRKIVLRMADPDDYSALGLADARDIAGTEIPPGRGFVDDDEVHFAIVGTDPAGEAQRRRIAQTATEVSRDGESSVPILRLLPLEVRVDTLRADVEKWRVVLGERDETHDPHIVDLANGHFFVAGPYRSGRTTALETIASGLVANGVEVAVLAPRPSRLVEVPGVTSHVGEETITAFVATLAGVVDGRKPADRPLAIVFDDAEAFVDSYAMDGLLHAVKVGRTSDVRIVAAAEIGGVRSSYSGWVPEVRKDQHGLLLQPDVDSDGAFLAVALPRRLLSEFPPGRGFAAERGTATLIQVAAAR